MGNLTNFTAVVENVFGDKIFLAVKKGDFGHTDVVVVDDGGISPLSFFIDEDYQEFLEGLQIRTITEVKEQYMEVA